MSMFKVSLLLCEKNNKEMVIESIELTSYQKDFFREFIKQDSNIYVILSPRQVGKSITLEQLMFYQAINKPNQYVMFLSPTFSQARKVFRETRDLIQDSGTLRKANESTLELLFVNGSQVSFKSAEQGQSLRGFTCTLLIIDEAAYVSDEVFNVLLPTTNAKKAKIVLASTPNFKDGFFYQYYTDGCNNINGVMSFDWSKYDLSQFLPTDKLEVLRRTVPIIRFQTEYLAKFIDNDQFGVFQGFENCVYKSAPAVTSSTKFYAGIDWGAGVSGDHTVVTIIDNEKVVRDLLILEGEIAADEAVKKIEAFLKKWRVTDCMVEKNSIGQIYKDMLSKAIGKTVNITVFNTTNDSKRNIIEKLAIAFQNRTIQIPQNETLLTELSKYQIEKTRNGSVTYNAQSGYHDDTVMSLAIAFHFTNKASYNWVS